MAERVVWPTNLLLLLCAYVPPICCNLYHYLCYIVRGRVSYVLIYLLTYISANFGPDWPLLFKVHEI